MLEKIKTALLTYQDPYLGVSLAEANVFKSIELKKQNTATVSLVLGFPSDVYKAQLIQALSDFLEETLQLSSFSWSVDWEVLSVIQPHALRAGIKRLKTIKNVIAVASGKGGVGKSTVAVNLALALKKEGASVGLLDADIYGPSQACMLGVEAPAMSQDGKHFEPTLAHGLYTNSMAYLIAKEETPMIWRGPMVGRALEQLFFDTNWPALDYLIIDLPPGTGDVSLTLVQKIPLTGVVMVTTPQKVAVLDVKKALTMFAKVNIPILGIVENMAAHACPSCGHLSDVFGEKGGEILAEQYKTPFLGRLELAKKMCESSEAGIPWMAQELPEYMTNKNTQVFYEIAGKASAQLALMKVDYSGKLPGVVVE